MLKSTYCGLFAVMMAAVLANAVQAADETTHEGVVVSAGENELVMTGKDKKEHTHAIGDDTKITLNTKAAKLADLKEGDAVKVTTDADGKVTAVAATRDKE